MHIDNYIFILITYIHPHPLRTFFTNGQVSGGKHGYNNLIARKYLQISRSHNFC